MGIGVTSPIPATSNILRASRSDIALPVAESKQDAPKEKDHTKKTTCRKVMVCILHSKERRIGLLCHVIKNISADAHRVSR